jgi:hypothetical protein
MDGSKSLEPKVRPGSAADLERMEEQQAIYLDNLQDIMDNTRWYLDNLDYLVEYKVYWNTYTKFDKNGKRRATLPFHLQERGK